MCVSRDWPRSERRVEAQLSHQGAGLHVPGSPLPLLLHGNDDAHCLGHRKWSGALAPSAGGSTV